MMFTTINNGVYRCGFSGSQDAYNNAFDQLFGALDTLEERLADNRYLMGDRITEADVRLFPTLVRFDAVYHNHFKCNRNRISDMPHLWGYLRDLYQTPGSVTPRIFSRSKSTITLFTGISTPPELFRKARTPANSPPRIIASG